MREKLLALRQTPAARRIRGSALDGLGIVVYDPDWLNPYGREVAGTVAATGREVELIQTTNSDWAPVEVHRRRILSPGLGMLPLTETIVRRLLGSPRTVLLARRKHAAVVVCDTRDAYESLVFAGLAKSLRVPVVIIDHNPTEGRVRRGFTGYADSAMRRSADCVVVHLEDLALAAKSRGARRVAVIAHPPYQEWLKRFPVRRGSARRTSSQPFRVLFLGALREDKGWMEVAHVLTLIATQPVELLLAGRGDMAPAEAEALEAAGVKYRRINAGGFATDEEIATAVSMADVLLAPYVNVTQSGTVVLAVTCGLPVVGYRSPGLSSLVAAECLVPAGDRQGLADVLRALRDGHLVPALPVTGQQLAQASRGGWESVLKTVETR